MKTKSDVRTGLLSLTTTFTVAFTALIATSAYGVTETYSSAGTTNWVCPPGVTSIQVECWGGGGAGGGSYVTLSGSANAGGAGGGGGAYAKKVNVPVTPGSTYTITIPAAATCPTTAGGTGGFSSNQRFNGSPVTFTGDGPTTVTANGGQGGQSTIVSTATAVSGNVGAGGAAGIGYDAAYAGGTSTNWAAGNGSGGGGGAGDLGNGGGAAAVLSSFGAGGLGSDANHTGGNGGAATNAAATGVDASSPGGGGGGAKSTSTSKTSRRGGNGGLGRMILTFPDPPSITKADNITDLNVGASWVGTVAPTSTEVAKWNSTVTAANTTVLGADLTWAGISVVNPTGLVTINAGNTLTLGAAYRDIDMSAATADLTLNCPLALANDTVMPANIWDVNTGRTLTLGGVVSGSFPLTKQGSGTLVLQAANDFSGALSVTGGTLAFTNLAALNNVSGIAMSGGTALRPDVTSATITKPITVGATATTVTITAPSTVHPSGGTNPAPITFGGKISGDGNLTFRGIQTANAYSTIVLNNANDYAGSTLITATNTSTNTEIFVKLGIANALPATTVLTLDGDDGAATARYCQLDLNGNNQTLAGLRNVTRNSTRVQRVVNSSGTAATLTVGNSSDHTYSAELGWTSGSFGTAAYRNFGLTKSGSGTLTLGGANSYTGATAIDNGTLEISNLSALGNTTGITIAGGATLVPAIDAVTINKPITLGTSGTTSTINAPTSGATGALVQTLTLSGKISGAGDLTLNGSNGLNTYGTIILGAANDYLGSTRIDCSVGGATCWVKNGTTNALPATTVLTLDGGPGSGTGRTLSYDLNGYNQTLAGLTNATGFVARRQLLDNTGAAATLTVNNADDYTFGVSPGTDSYARIQGAISLVKSGIGIFTLFNSHTYTGTTTVSAGTLKLGTSNVLPATAVSIGAGTLDVGAGFTDTVGTLDCTGAATINLGTGATLVFADSNTIGGTGDWVGTLNITGAFVSGSSIKFATTGGLTAGQLAKISVTGFTGFALDASGFLTASAAGGYSSWQASNGPTTQTIDLDHDNDGVSNGVEYFLGGNTNTTGSTAVPSVINTAGVLSVTWTKAASYTGTYGTDFWVETSATLTGAWATEPADPTPGFNVTFPSATEVKYTFPPGTKNFARLKVTGP
jgi:autotransporter-associated beta strand protein